MKTDIDNLEYVQPEVDEDGNYIPSSDIPDTIVETDVEDLENSDDYYAAIVIPEDEPQLSIASQEPLHEAVLIKEELEEIKEQIVKICTDMTTSGERTQEQVIELSQLKSQYVSTYENLSSLLNLRRARTIDERISELSLGMKSITTDGLLDILTDGGRKSWLYSDEEGNVLVDSTSIPELTLLARKLSLIATDGENEGEIQLTPTFIKQIVSGTGNGEAINNITSMYYLSTSKIELLGGTWVESLPTEAEQQGKFLWYKLVTTFLDSELATSETSPICITGQDGQDGQDGQPGKDGQDGQDGQDGKDGISTYTWIKYANDAEGTGISDDPTGKTYIGFAYNKTIPEESLVTSDYTWSLIKGEKGDTGVQGPTGPNGITTYTWIRYSDSSDGTNNYDTPTADTKYIGIATNKTVATESTVKTDYVWSKFKGEQGVQGPQGNPTYTWIKYADDSSGGGLSDSPVDKKYIGMAYNKTTATESTTKTDYTWSLIQGEKGDTGVQGPTGPQGNPTYTWIKYSNNSDGTDLYDTPNASTQYIGIATNKTSATESATKTDYTWSKFKGDQGIQGPVGPATYTWIKYSNSSDGTDLSDDPTGKLYIGFAYNKTTATESTTKTDYTWSLIKGEKGNTGATGPTGPQGNPTYTWIKYSNNSDGTDLYDTPTSTTQYIGIATNKSSATESSTKTDYTWSKFKGDQGVQGPQGNTGPQGPATYTWIKYATSSTGAGLSDSPSGMTYIGMAYNKTTSTESTTASDYTWSLIKGDKGDTGVQGPTGPQGNPTYTWIKYSNNADGTDLYDTPTSSTTYIGIAPNKASATESSVKTDYTWSKFKGDTGVQGPQGPQGPQGEPTYTWIKYADSSTGSGLSDSPTGKLYIGLAYNKTTSTESTTPGDYTWSLIKGDKGDTGVQGPTGPQGGTGPQGPTGPTGPATYTWIKYSDSSDGTGLYDTPTSSTLYIGIATNKSTATESSVKTDYTWSKFKGDQGIQGPQGAPTYTWIKYATSSTGAGLSDSPSGMTYIGLAYNKTSPTESTTASDYTWSLIKGDKGDTGIQGPTGGTGPQGPATYTWIKYSNSSDGTDLYDTPTSATTYIGIATNKSSATESAVKTDYTWSKFKGDQGVQGPAGPTTYTWIKYATSSSGAGLSDSPSGMTYIGMAYNKTTATESTTASDYTWSLIKGDKGDTGVQGPTGGTGPQGPATYTWIKYSDSSDGSNLYDTPTSTTQYIGIAPNKTTATESATKTDYTWSKFKGDTGVQGPTGPQGPQGSSAQYVLVTGEQVFKYTNNFSGTPTPSSITLTVSKMNTTATGSWQYKNASNVWTDLGATATTVSITPTTGLFATASVRSMTVRYLIGTTIWDELTIVKVSDGATGPQGSTGPTGPTGSTGPQGEDGADGYTIVLSNESHTFPGSTSAALAGYTTCSIMAYKGTKRVGATIGTITGMPTGMTVTLSYNNTTSAYFTVDVTTSMTSASGILTVPITVDGKEFTKEFTYTIAFKGATGGTGPTGPTGPQGGTGVGVTDVRLEYATSTSTTTAPTSGFGTTMPSYVAGSYLWVRTGVKYTNSSTYTYSTPICDQAWKGNQATYSQYVQLKDSFSWIVQSGTSASSMVLTPSMYSILSTNLSLKGKNINITGDTTITGMVTLNNFFKILTDGTAEAIDMNVEGTLSTNDLSVKNINNSIYPASLDESITVSINPSATASATEWADGAVYKSYTDLEESIPKNLNGFALTINLAADHSENIKIDDFTNGRIRLQLNKHILKGWVFNAAWNLRLDVFGNVDGTTGGTTNYGSIMPNAGYLTASYRVNLGATWSDTRVWDVKFYNNKSTDVSTAMMLFSNGTTNYVSNCIAVNTPYCFVRALTGACTIVTDTSGITANRPFHALTGARVVLNATKQAGRSGTDTTAAYHCYTASNGEIISTGATWDTVASTGTNDSGTVATSTKTVTLTATSGDTFRLTEYKNWKGDGSVRQGTWGYGNCVGCWFFGTKISSLKGKTVTSVVIKFKRQSGGNNGAVTHTLKLHNHASRPASTVAPDFLTTLSKTASCAVGNTATITLTASEITAFMSAKGFGLVPADQTTGYYSVCAGGATVTITYTE